MKSTERDFVFPESLWMGSEHSLLVAQDAHHMLMAGLFSPQPASPDIEEVVPYTFSRQGEVGIISIRGPLVNIDSPWERYMSVTSYMEIRRALIYGASQSDVKAILLDIASGGGAVSGCADCGDLIATIDKSVKPVYTFSGDLMGSAATWLGLGARKVYVSKSTISGSIGVISTHKEYSKALKEAGIGVTVQRAGEFKALANQFEPLSDAAKKQIQGQLDEAYKLFIEWAAERRGTSVQAADAAFGQGREFFGEAAVAAGLADGVSSFDGVVSLINKKIDANRKREQTVGNHSRGMDMTRQALTEQQIAAMAAGAPGEAVVDAADLAAAQATLDAAALAAAATATTSAAAAPTAPTAPTEPLVTFLQAQIKDKDAMLLAQSIELSGVKSQIASLQASQAGLVAIAATSVSNMRVALRMSKIDFSNLSPEALLAEHAATAELFKASLPVGGVAAVAPPADAKAPAALDPAIAARVQANRIPARK